MEGIPEIKKKGISVNTKNLLFLTYIPEPHRDRELSLSLSLSLCLRPPPVRDAPAGLLLPSPLSH